MRVFAVLIIASLLVYPDRPQAQTQANYTVLSVPGSYNLTGALRKARELLAQDGAAVAIEISTGVYYLTETIELGTAFSGSAAAPFIIRAAEGANVVLSGGERLNLSWETYNNTLFRAPLDGASFGQLFMNGKLQVRARFPNYDSRRPTPSFPFNGTDRNAISPTRIASKGWTNPVGGFLHALHSARWASTHHRITAFNSDTDTVTLGSPTGNNGDYIGGGQPHATYRFVENVFEELDSTKEWFYDSSADYLYYYPTEGFDLNCAVVEVPRLETLIRIKSATDGTPVKHIRIEGFEFVHAFHTFEKTTEPLLMSDWKIYRGGAVFLENTEDITISNNHFHSLGGNAIFASNYNRRVMISSSEFHDLGAGAINFVGSPTAVRSPRFSYNSAHSSTVDWEQGPKNNKYPSNSTAHDNLIHHIGLVEKQVAGVHISMSRKITASHNTIYRIPRAGINVSEGTWGGHVIEYNDIFHAVQETEDHGAFNSWGRDRFWSSAIKRNPILYTGGIGRVLLDAVDSTIIRYNRMMCEHGWDIDLDDGSSNYQIYGNIALHGGIKLREGFRRIVTNNIVTWIDMHMWFNSSEDQVKRNIVVSGYRTAYPVGQTFPWTALATSIDYNLIVNLARLTEFQANGTDQNSLSGSPNFVDAEAGDFTVVPGSPALSVGFVNIPMDQFGVVSPRLKARAEAAPIPML